MWPTLRVSSFVNINYRVSMLGLPQDAAHAMSTTNAKSLVLRARECFDRPVQLY